MKKYVMPETVNVSILGAFIMGTAESVASAVGNPHEVDPGMGMAPKKVI